MSKINPVITTSTLKKRKNTYSPQFKFDRALEALRTNNIADIARKYNINPNVLYIWRDQLIGRGATVFTTTPDHEVKELKSKLGQLEQMVGKKEVELNLLKNFSDFYSSRNQP